MAAISQQIPNLLGGVSQQPDSVKLPGQVREAINVYLDPTFGASKRPPTRFIKQLATDIPEDARWFPIIRDSNERYVMCMYNDGAGNTTCRVFDCNDGVERTVTLAGDSNNYLQAESLDSLNTLTINDYTFISNSERVITMSGDESTVRANEALVVIENIAYNTNYSIDFSSPGNATEQVKKYRATALSISPGSFEVGDGGTCGNSGAETFSNITGGNNGSGLAFRVAVQCAAYLTGGPGNYAYNSRYTASVTLINGGENWRVGDTVTVNAIGRNYTITVTGETFAYAYAGEGSASYTTPPTTEEGVLDVGLVTSGLVDAVNQIDNYEATAIGNVVHIVRQDDGDFNVATRGGTSNRAMYGIKDAVNDVSRLPSQCVPGYVVKVNNLEDLDADDYYVVFEASTAGVPGMGSWEETVRPGIEIGLNASTMPQALIREADGNFTLRPLDVTYDEVNSWASREVGDTGTNPDPSFVGKTISGMFFFANRFGVLSGDTVVMTQPGDYFNFFTASAIAVSDADPIDLAASATKPATLRAAIGTAAGLILFAENSQFLLATQETSFASGTVKLTELSSYNYSSLALPVDTGVSTVFASDSTTSTKCFEMAVNISPNARPQVADITRAIPDYIPPGMKFSSVSPNNSFFLLGDYTNTVYTFRFFNTGDERQLAGWSKWVYPGKVRLHAFDNDTSFMVQIIDGHPVLVRSEMLDDPDSSPINAVGRKFDPRQDFYSAKEDLTLVQGETQTKIYYPVGAFVEGHTPSIIFSAGSFEGTYESPPIQEDAGGKYIEIDNIKAEDDFFLGLQYEFSVELPTFYVKAQDRADKMNIPVVETVYFDTYLSGMITAKVSRLGYDDFEVDLDPGLVDTTAANTPIMRESASQKVQPYTLGNILYITLSSDTPLPTIVNSYSWEGHYNNRGVSILR